MTTLGVDPLVRSRTPPYGWLLLILLLAAGLRLAALSQIPPGMTHDEADHGLDAWGVVQGIRPLYFTVGYGREPLFDYATAGLMSFLGPTYLAGRLTAVFFSLLFLAGSYAWSCVAFGRRTALLAAAGLAIGFWPLMSARQALRSATLPTLLVLVAYFYWRAVTPGAADKWPRYGRFLMAGFLLGLAFYSYIPARLWWLIFPALLLYTALTSRPLPAHSWRGVLLMLLVMGAVAAPLLLYLARHPDVEVRIAELSTPLTAAREGDWQPLLHNARASLRLFTVNGDPTWRYNLPGRPWLNPLMGALFYAGLLLALWRIFRPRARERRPAAHFFALSWLLLGLSPSLVTGPSLSMTQAIAVQPVLYLFPALALDALADWRPIQTTGRLNGALALLVLAFLFGTSLSLTIRDYFGRWANAPEVRVQYETTLVTAIDYLNQQGQGAAAVSTTTPNRFHSPAVGQMFLSNEAVDLRWFNGQHSLLLPQDEPARLIFSGFAPLNLYLAAYFDAVSSPPATVPLRATDQDRPLQIYTIDARGTLAAVQVQFTTAPALPAEFGDAAALLGYDLQTPTLPVGTAIRLATLWQVNGPTAEELVLFSHVLDAHGEPVAQADRLDVPSTEWSAGDLFIQLHQIQLPPDLSPGNYRLTTGLYSSASEQRLPVLIDGLPRGDFIELTAVTIIP